MKSRDLAAKAEEKKDLRSYSNKVALTVIGVLIYGVLAPTAGFFGTLLCIKVATVLGYI